MKGKSPTRLAVLLLGFLALHCGGQQERRTDLKVDLEKVDPSGQRVVFWYQHTRAREDALLAMIDEFNATNPHKVVVAGEYSGNYGDIYNKMLVALQGGTPPSLVVAYQNQALAYQEADGLVDLSPYMESPKWGLSPQTLADHVKTFVDQDNVAGVQIGFPPNRSMELLYFNFDWLRELGREGPPQTWQEFADLCRLARTRPFSRADNPSNSLGFYLEADASRLASMVFSRGGTFLDEEGSAYAFDTPETRDALNLIQALVREGAAKPVGEPYLDQTEFAVGNVLFALRSSSGLPFFKSSIEEAGIGFDWRVGPPPHGEAEPVVNVYGASVSVCRTTPEQQLAAWLFLKWFTEPAQQARWVRASNYFPVRRSAAESLKEYFEANANYRTAYGLLDFGRSEPALAGYQQVRRMIADAMVEILDGADVESRLGQLDRDANATIYNR